jgi:hypothetical protein
MRKIVIPKRQRDQLEDDYKHERISRREYEAKKKQIEAGFDYLLRVIPAAAAAVVKSARLDVGSSRNLKRSFAVCQAKRLERAIGAILACCGLLPADDTRKNELYR